MRGLPRNIDLPTLRGAWWAVRAVRVARRHAAGGRLDGAALPPVPADGSRRGVAAVLRRRSDTCLVRASVLQAWDAAHGHPRDLIIGVTAPAAGFRAHAWLDGEPAGEEFEELLRRSPP